MGQHRELLHTRNISCNAYRIGENLFELEAVLEDTRTIGVAWRCGKVQPEDTPIHLKKLILKVDLYGTILDATAETVTGPFEECRDSNVTYKQLQGLQIKGGFTDAVNARIKKVDGCTHLSLLVSLLANTYVQMIWPILTAPLVRNDVPLDQWPQEMFGAIDQCYGWRSEGKALKMEYPEIIETLEIKQ